MTTTMQPGTTASPAFQNPADQLLAARGMCTWRELQAAGVSAGLARARVASRRWWRPFRGVYADRTTPATPSTYARAALLIAPQAVVSHGTALQLYGPQIRETVRAHAELTVDPASPTVPERPGLLVHSVALTPAEIVVHKGLRLAAPDRVGVDLACREAPGIGLAVLDQLLGRGLTTQEQLLTCVGGLAGMRGIARARRLVPLADGRSESPMETLLRWIFVAAGLPEPEIQYVYVDRYGQAIARLDFYWREARLAVEYDGWDAHMGDSSLFNTDRRRQNLLLAEGVLVLRFTASDVYRFPEKIVQLVRAELLRRTPRH